jgi:hypothetical protein
LKDWDQTAYNHILSATLTYYYIVNIFLGITNTVRQCTLTGRYFIMCMSYSNNSLCWKLRVVFGWQSDLKGVRSCPASTRSCVQAPAQKKKDREKERERKKEKEIKTKCLRYICVYIYIYMCTYAHNFIILTCKKNIFSTSLYQGQ